MSLLLRLQLEIDGDVHPELYTLLASLPLESSQAERLRQLAATGLIWEQLRAQARRRPAVAAPVAAAPRAAAREPVEIPVLREVVPAGELVRFRDALARRVAEGSAGVRRVFGVAVAPDAAPAAEARAAEPSPPVALDEPVVAPAMVEPPNDAPPRGYAAEDAAPPRTHGRRSRLLRMKEKGLFGAG